jgi:hypothetical protein
MKKPDATVRKWQSGDIDKRISAFISCHPFPSMIIFFVAVPLLILFLVFIGICLITLIGHYFYH